MAIQVAGLSKGASPRGMSSSFREGSHHNHSLYFRHLLCYDPFTSTGVHRRGATDTNKLYWLVRLHGSSATASLGIWRLSDYLPLHESGRQRYRH